ncbi:MAG TPA: hypothetical protein VIT91_21045 [Chthoniobacterales bacterium]
MLLARFSATGSLGYMAKAPKTSPDQLDFFADLPPLPAPSEIKPQSTGATPAHRDQLDRWRLGRQRQVEELCRHLGVPLNRAVEVILKQGPIHSGILRLSEDSQLWFDVEDVKRDAIPLRIDSFEFRLGEVESVVRQDG